MMIRDNAGRIVPWGRLVREDVRTFFPGGTVPPEVTVTDGTPSPSPRPAGGLRLTGQRLRLEGPEVVLSTQYPTVQPSDEGARALVMDLHYTGSAYQAYARFVWQGPAGSVGVEKTLAGDRAVLQFIARDAAGAATRSEETNLDHGFVNEGDLNFEKRYQITTYYVPKHRRLYLATGDAIQDTFSVTDAELAHGPVRPVVELWVDDGEITKDFHQLTAHSHWL